MAGFKMELSKLKPNLEVNKGLKIKELEKENSYLQIQINKYKKQLATLRPLKQKHLKGIDKHNALMDFSKKQKSIRAKHQEEKLVLARSINKWKEKCYEHIAREDFITLHFIKNLGKDKFIETTNRLDNPVKKSKISTVEKMERFKANYRFEDE